MQESLKYIRNLKSQEKIYQANTKKELINLDALVGGMYGVWKKYGGNHNYEERRIWWLLLCSIDCSG